jgi:hypothetical protein
MIPQTRVKLYHTNPHTGAIETNVPITNVTEAKEALAMFACVWEETILEGLGNENKGAYFASVPDVFWDIVGKDGILVMSVLDYVLELDAE